MLMCATSVLLDDIKSERVRLEKEILSADGVNPSGTVYYVSPDGDDQADGRSPGNAWRTSGAADAHGVGRGDTVLFERGGVWRGGLAARDGVTYSAYGSGEKPCIYGSPFDGAVIGAWDMVSENVWRYSEPIASDVGGIFFDGGARRAEKVTLNYAGGEPVDNVSGRRFYGFRSLEEDLTFWHDLGGRISIGGDEMCSGEDDEGRGYVYLCSERDPSERFSEIEFLPRRNVVQVCGDDVHIDNLTIRYGGAHGVGSGTAKGLSVTNCVIEYIGGSVQYYTEGRPVRFGNGVEIWGGCEDYTVDHCIIREIYDAGVTHQYKGGTDECFMRRIRYTDNVITNCTYAVEYFLGAPENDAATRYMEDVLIKGNFLGYSGYGFGNGRPDKSTPALIKSWDSRNTALSDSFVIEDNTLCLSAYKLIHICAAEEGWLPVLSGNTFIQNVGGELGMYGKSPAPSRIMSAGTTVREEFAGNEFYIIDND